MAASGAPTALRIGGRTWDIQHHHPDRMGDCMGLCRYAEGVIEIRMGQADFELRDTMLHEVLHAVLYHQGRSGNASEEETFVRATATGLIGVLQDNPLFAKWLVKPLNKPQAT